MNATLTVLRPGCGAFCASVIDKGANLTVSKSESIIAQTNAVSEALVLGVSGSGGDRRSLEFWFWASLGHCNEVFLSQCLSICARSPFLVRLSL